MQAYKALESLGVRQSTGLKQTLGHAQPGPLSMPQRRLLHDTGWQPCCMSKHRFQSHHIEDSQNISASLPVPCHQGPSPTSLHPCSVSPTFHSQIKTEVLLLLKEVIHDELAHEVRVERVVNDLGASKLQENEYK